LDATEIIKREILMCIWERIWKLMIVSNKPRKRISDMLDFSMVDIASLVIKLDCMVEEVTKSAI
jgi:hypothetical protein